MKKISLVLLMCIALVFGLASCLGDTPDECTVHTDEDGDGKCDVCEAEVEPEEKPEEKPGEKPASDFILIKDGVAKFQIVTATTAPGGSNFKKAVDGLVKTLDDLDIEVKSVAEKADNAEACEVIIGAPTTRGDAYKYDVHTLGYEGYAIKLVEGKVLILGGSEESLIEAIKIFTEDFLGIDKKTKELDNVTVKSSQWVEEIQDDYRITALKLNGEDMRGYTIAYDATDKYSIEVAASVQNIIYTKTGIWLDFVSLSEADKSIVIKIVPNTYEGNGYSAKVDGTTLTFECEFPDSMKAAVDDFFASNVTLKSGEVDFTSKHNTTKNLREICYNDARFGAKGNGTTDDFDAIRACHEYANTWGHTVVANAKSTYYIGAGHGTKTINVRTDTDWKGCKFIFDDSKVGPKTKERETSIFTIAPDVPEEVIVNISKNIGTTLFAHVTPDTPWIDEGDNITTNIGWAPGESCMLIIISKEAKHYVRYGPNQTDGEWQEELILVDAEGNIDPTTPLQWSYTQIDKVTKYSVNERPITVGHAKIETIANCPDENSYDYYARNISIMRSKSTVTDIYHTIVGEGDTGCPYTGKIHADYCTDVVISDYSFRHPKSYTAEGSNGESSMGTYGLGAGRANNVLCENIDQYDLRNEEGIVNTGTGAHGSNYCKNLRLNNSKISLFDAHRGSYNVFVTNSQVRAFNLIGEGLIYLENVTFVGGDNEYSLGLRQDYGSTWKGEVMIKDCKVELNSTRIFNLFRITGYISDWDFGYTCYFPEKITIDGLTCVNLKGQPLKDVTVTFSEYLCKKFNNTDISIPGSEGGGGGINPYIGCKEVIIKNCQEDIIWRMPDIPMFKDMKLTIDGVTYEAQSNWKAKYGYLANK